MQIEYDDREVDFIQPVMNKLGKGLRDRIIIKYLMEKDFTEKEAISFIEKVRIEYRMAMLKYYIRHMIYGLLLLLGGAAFTAVTYWDAASRESGGTYYVAWGAMATGAIDLVRAIYGYFKV